MPMRSFIVYKLLYKLTENTIKYNLCSAFILFFIIIKDFINFNLAHLTVINVL